MKKVNNDRKDDFINKEVENSIKQLEEYKKSSEILSKKQASNYNKIYSELIILNASLLMEISESDRPQEMQNVALWNSILQNIFNYYKLLNNPRKLILFKTRRKIKRLIKQINKNSYLQDKIDKNKLVLIIQK